MKVPRAGRLDNVVFVPAGVTKLEGISRTRRKKPEKFFDAATIFLELWRQLKQDCDEFRRLPGEHEVVRSLLRPSPNRRLCRRPIEHSIQLSRTKATGIELKVQTRRKVFRKERASPRGIALACTRFG